MPSSKNPKHRGKRAKTKPEKHLKRERTRPAEQQALRLQQAITKHLERNPISDPTGQNTVSTISEGADPALADQQERTPSGVVKVSVDSESDCAILPSDECSLSDCEGFDTSTGRV